MTLLYIVPSCMFFILNFSVSNYAAAGIIENFDDKIDWKMAVGKINQLEKLVKEQDKRISALEKRPTESEWRSLTEELRKQNDRIAHLETKISKLEIPVEDKENKSIRGLSTEVSKDAGNALSSEQGISSKKRLLLQPTTVPIEMVAFFAYFSSNHLISDAAYILAFDAVITNVGNAYHPHSGTFIAPRSGLYVFTWTIRESGTNYHTTELLVNNKIVNAIHLNPGNAIDGTGTGTVVVHINQGDDVLVRTGSNYNNGYIFSSEFGRSSFAGWILN